MTLAFRKNILLLMSIPSIGYNTAINEFGKFKGDRVKMFKRGIRFGRKVLYAAALVSIRMKRNG